MELSLFQALGCGSVAQFVLAKQQFGNYFSVDFGWGMGVAFGIYWAGGISGECNILLLSIRSSHVAAL